MIGALVAWILYKHFATERFEKALAFDYDAPFRDLQNLVSELNSVIEGGPSAARKFLTSVVRQRCSLAAGAIRDRILFFGRFLEVEQLSSIHEAYEASRQLSILDGEQPDAVFMSAFSRHVASLYVYAHASGVPEADSAYLERIHQVHRQWFEQSLVERYRL
jgi:hypothetical protein